MLTALMKKRRDQRRIIAAVGPTKPGAPSDALEDEHEAQYRPLRWPVIRQALSWMAPFKRKYILATIAGLSVNLLDMLGPLYIRHLVDCDIPNRAQYQAHFLGVWATRLVSHWGSTSTIERMSGELTGAHMPYWNISLTILLWALTITAALTLQRFGILYTNRIGQQVIFSLRRAVFTHLQKMSMSFYDRTKFGRILTRGTSDIDAMSNPIVWGINTTVSLLAMMIISASIIVIIDWRVALSVLWLGPILYFMSIKYRQRVGQQWRAVREHFTRVSTNLVENINGMKVVAAFNRQEDNLAQFNALQETNTEKNLGAAHINGIYQPLLQIVGFLGKLTILIVGCYLVFATRSAAKPFTVGMLIACWLYWDWFMNPVIQFGNFYNEMMMSMASAERVFALLDQKPEIVDDVGALPLPPIEGKVEFEHVHFSYDPKKPVLHDICFTAMPGQTIALVGHTGCGKSTIMNLICRFYLPQSGQIFIDDHDTRRITGQSLHRQMGIVSQSNYLFSGTVIDNIRYARPESTDEQVIAAAKLLGSDEIISSLKDGYQTPVGERGSSMSLGQRQLICFTRAFLANPRILMLDEATSAVDTHTELLIQQALERLVADRTTFIVAHRLSTVVNADLVLVLDHGRIIERGSHRELLAIPNGKYAELYKQFTREIAD